MDFDINKQRQEENDAMKTPNTMNAIYKEELSPLKTKISQILLYDTEKAEQLLKEYNNIIRKEKESSIQEILKDIVELEYRIKEYENDEGKQKLSEDEKTAIIEQLDNLMLNCENLKTEDLQDRLFSIREIYNENLENYSYAIRDVIVSKISSVQTKLIIKKVREGALDLYDDISKEDEENLRVIIYNKIYEIMQGNNPNIQDVVNRLKLEVMNRTDAVYDPKIWKLLDSVEKEEEQNTQEDTHEHEIASQSEILPALSKRSKGRFNLSRILQVLKGDTIRIGNQTMKLESTVQLKDKTIKVRDLANINMKWLAEQMPEEMLVLIEEVKRLKEEEHFEGESYLPDKKTPIYDFFKGYQDTERAFTFYDEEGIELKFEISAYYNSIIIRNGDDTWKKSFELIYNSEREELDLEFKIKTYTEFIDKIVGSNISQQFCNEFGTYFEKRAINGKHYKDMYPTIKELPIYRNLQESYDYLKEECKKTEKVFRDKEAKNREEFYKKDNFKNSLKVVNEMDEEEPPIEPPKRNIGGRE